MGKIELRGPGPLGCKYYNYLLLYTFVLLYAKMLKETETEETRLFCRIFYHWWHNFDWGARAPWLRPWCGRVVTYRFLCTCGVTELKNFFKDGITARGKFWHYILSVSIGIEEQKLIYILSTCVIMVCPIMDLQLQNIMHCANLSFFLCNFDCSSGAPSGGRDNSEKNSAITMQSNGSKQCQARMAVR